MARVSALILCVLLVVGGAHGDTPVAPPLAGTWTFGPDSTSTIDCPALGRFSTTLAGTRPAIYAGAGSDLIFDLGCHCRLTLQADGAGSAASVAPQTCALVNDGVPMTGEIDQITLTATGSGTVGFSFAGTNATLTLGTAICSGASFSGTGTLSFAGPDVVVCGDDATAVGVPTYFPGGNGTCMISAGREGLQIQMHDEDTPACSDETGSAGEAPWLLPDDDRQRRRDCSNNGWRTVLNFCRVDGGRFRPMTISADPNQYYAVLKLGSRCPAGSVEVSKTIDNEDMPGGARSLVLGDAGPANTVVGDPAVGTVTTLVFCYFRNAASAADTMSAFPDLGFQYSVFHRYDGEQPPWVIAKRWQWSNDEDSQYAKNGYQGGDATVVEEFKSVVENPQNDTIFNIARVR